MTVPSPVREAERLEALRRFRILDTLPECEFDDIALLAAHICRTPIAMVSLVDADRQWFKAKVGVAETGTARDIAFCAHAILGADLFVVPDATADERFAGNPFVTGAAHIRFYAGAPLVTPEGHALGTLCVLDRTPRELAPEQASALGALARQVVSLLELRRAHADLAEIAAARNVAEEALRASEELKTRIIDSSRDCIKLLDLDGRLLSMNAGGMETLEICDFTPLRGSSWADLWPEDGRAAVRSAIDAARGGRVARFVGFCPTATGKPKWWDVVVNAIHDVQGRPERLLAVSRDVTEQRRAQEALREVTEGTAEATGSDFFYSLVRHLASAAGVRHAFVAECPAGNLAKARTLAFWQGDGFHGNVEYETQDTPCEGVLTGNVCFHPRSVQGLFPKDEDLKKLAAESYLAVPILDAQGRILGHLAILDDKPMAEEPQIVAILRIFAARAGAELERLRAEAGLRTALAEVEALKGRLEAENLYLQEEIRAEHNFEEIVGNSPALLGALRKVEKVSGTDSAVLLLGETGVGKELFARAIHSRSLRRDRPLVKVNCGAIPAGLVESELFGHVKGAFTGALQSRVGRFELAHGGTIFLDEIAELPLETQVKLLRVLQEREFEPVGSSRTVRVDVRVIAATNRDLEDCVRTGRFRADLLYRLNVFPITVPPLRERPGDIPLLAAFFVAQQSKRLGKTLDGFSRGSMERLTRYGWPGNVREMQNVVERAAILAQGPILELEGEILAMTQAPMESAPSSSLLDVERDHILEVLGRTGWVIEGPRGAATLLGLHPNTLRSRMKKLEIRRARSAQG
jgi:PAS domain S-box-containing protein